MAVNFLQNIAAFWEILQINFAVLRESARGLLFPYLGAKILEILNDIVELSGSVLQEPRSKEIHERTTAKALSLWLWPFSLPPIHILLDKCPSTLNILENSMFCGEVGCMTYKTTAVAIAMLSFYLQKEYWALNPFFGVR